MICMECGERAMSYCAPCKEWRCKSHRLTHPCTVREITEGIVGLVFETHRRRIK